MLFVIVDRNWDLLIMEKDGRPETEDGGLRRENKGDADSDPHLMGERLRIQRIQV
jgi:hypothetical protein